MASNLNLHPSDPRYEPLPPPNFDGLSPPGTPVIEHPSIPMEDLPAGASRPRFQGLAAQEDGTHIRDSYASSNYAGGGGSLNSSVYALNPGGAAVGSAATRSSNYYAGGYRDDPQGDEFDDASSPGGSPGGASTPAPAYLAEKRAAYASPAAKSKKRWWLIGGGALALIAVAVALGVVFGTKKKSSADDDSGNSESSSGGGSSDNTPGQRNVVTGGDGSEVTMDDGSKFTYQNSFGGYWYYDPEDPFNNAARAQSWSPALNETFKYGEDIIRGVNLGGWLVTEPFISPALFEPYVDSTPSAIDEWTLSQNMRADSANGGINQLEEHYKTFITEKDFAQIAGAGLNWVRIPIPFWAIETRDGEPFLAKTCWTYFLKAIQWARKYGIRINLDLHALPGSQNGWNHSGKLGSVNMLNGPMGYANAQRSLDYIRIFAEFISQDEYKDVVAMFGIANEPQGNTVGLETLERFYFEAYNIVRRASGTGEGKGPMVSFHDGFMGLGNWAGYLPGADRIAIDLHPYIAFGGQSASPVASFQNTPCQIWAGNMNTSMSAFGLTGAGEFSNAINDCGLYVNGVNLGTRYDGTYTADGGSWPSVGSCDPVNDWENWSATTKQGYKNFALSSMDALQNYFFWTWKIGNSSVTGKVMSPQWSYQLGLENGWMPTDPREAIGACGNTAPWVGPLAPSATGGAGAGTIAASVSNAVSWPPASISNGGAVTALPSYTATGNVPTLAGVTVTATSGKTTTTITGGDGWTNDDDKDGLMEEVSGCTYLDPWVGDAAPPSPLCSNRRRSFFEPRITGTPLFAREH